jgi:tetrahydromethanopterin S-methyltransferase subunit B
MSKEVDQRIVEMQFNNADFESKVQQSLGTLQKLKEATKLEDAGKGLDNLAHSAHKLDLSSIAQGIEQLNGKFSALGIAGMTVMQRLTNAAIDMGNQVANAITAAPKDGWKEYELNLDSVKTILNSAKGADGLPVTLDKVNEKLAELNAYSDKTIYSFSDMTSNIGKFTNAGVDLDSAVKAIQGVANVAALAGANASDASRAMYNFGQALGSGSVKLID